MSYRGEDRDIELARRVFDFVFSRIQIQRRPGVWEKLPPLDNVPDATLRRLSKMMLDGMPPSEPGRLMLIRGGKR
jgi:hypothetical protein